MEKRVKTDFGKVKRDFETVYKSGKDYTPEITTLARVIVHSTLNRCMDPARKNERAKKVTNKGFDPYLIQLKYGIERDKTTIEGMLRNVNLATTTCFTENGEITIEVVDKSANEAAKRLVKLTISDGMDLINETMVYILNAAEEYADTIGWLDKKIVKPFLSRRVYIREPDSAAWKDKEVTPIQLIYKDLQIYIDNNRKIRVDVENGYNKLKNIDDMDKMYYNNSEYLTLRGYRKSEIESIVKKERDEAEEIGTMIEKLNLTPRQLKILLLRMENRGYKQIATYLGITPQTVLDHCKKIQSKAEKIDFTPSSVHEREKLDMDKMDIDG